MDPTEPLNDDEVVADSEDENEMDLYRPGAMGPPPVRETPSIYEFSPKRAPAISSISNFTAGPSNQPTYTSIAPTTSANPKSKKADTSIETYNADFENISASIADRAKTRQRSQKRPSDVIELSSDDNFDAYHEPPPPKAKPKPKPKLKSNPAEKEGWISTEPIATTSAATPGQAQAQTTAPRPRPRPVIRRSRPISADGDTGALYLPKSTPPHGPELPVATSPFRYPVSLPPSDLPFPVSSVSTTYNELYNNINNNIHNNSNNRNNNIPRIETIRNSSPDSLFSERSIGSSASKRRRTGVDTEAEIDELATPPQGSVFNFVGISPSKMPPPPTFFAGSSSSSMGQGSAGANANAAPAPFPLDSNAELDVNRELEPPEPSLMVIDGPPKAIATKAATKLKKQQKSKLVDDYDYDDVNFGAKAVVLDDDDMDCDFDPKGDGLAKTKKGKGKEKAKVKAKPKEKKEKTPKEPKGKGKQKHTKAGLGADAVTGAEVVYVGANDDVHVAKDAITATPAAGSSTSPSLVGRQQVEVVIVQKPKPGADKGKKTTKETVKGKEKEQDAFKSREFIEESEDDMDLISPPRKSSSSLVAAADASPNGVPTPEPFSGPSTKLAEGHPSSSSKKRTASSRTSGSIKGNDDDWESPIPKASSSSGKSASVAGKKKRKSNVDPDVDDDGDFQQDADGRAGGGEEEGVEVYAPESSVSAAKKRKVDSSASASAEKSKKGKKKSTVVLSDDDAGDGPTSHNKEKGTTKGKKTTRKIVQEEDEEEDQAIVLEVKSTPPESDVSENVEPPPKPVYSTPKPTSAHRLSTTKSDSDTKTPLYARYEIAPRKSSLPMSELIRRANSIPGSPFATPHASTPTSASSKLKPLLTGAGRTGATAYSPYMKASRSMLSRIAPLHPNRRTPPPPPPPPPPRKKSKKELEMEEKWEEEMVDSVGGMEAWAAMDDGERREMRKAKWARELGGWDE